MENAIPEFVSASVRSLPPLPTAVQRLMLLTGEVEVDFRQIARVIESDPTLTARTLRAANSPFYGVSRRVQTVQQATVLLGRDAILNLSLSVSVLNMQNDLQKRWPVEPAAFGRHSIAVALAARALAKALHLPDPEEAFVAGLMHDIGKLILLVHFGDEYARLVLAARNSASPLHRLEREFFEIDHAKAGQALCQHWNLPPSLTRAVAEHHAEAPGSLADVVAGAGHLAKMLRLGNSGDRFLRMRRDPSLPPLLVAPERLRETVISLPHEVQRAETALAQQSGGERRPVPVRVRPLVHLQVADPYEREVLTLMLLALGFEAMVPGETQALSAEQLREAPLAGLVTDVQGFDLRKLVYQQHNVPVLEYGHWRTGQASYADGYLSVDALREWLLQGIAHAAEAAVG